MSDEEVNTLQAAKDRRKGSHLTVFVLTGKPPLTSQKLSKSGLEEFGDLAVAPSFRFQDTNVE